MERLIAFNQERLDQLGKQALARDPSLYPVEQRLMTSLQAQGLSGRDLGEILARPESVNAAVANLPKADQKALADLGRQLALVA